MGTPDSRDQWARRVLRVSQEIWSMRMDPEEPLPGPEGDQPILSWPEAMDMQKLSHSRANLANLDLQGCLDHLDLLGLLVIL